jgi:hypothetical protein
MNKSKPIISLYRMNAAERKQMERIKSEEGIPFQVQIEHAMRDYLRRKRAQREAIQATEAPSERRRLATRLE